MSRIEARQLQVNDIIGSVFGKPNIRGTVMAVSRFSNQQAALLPSQTKMLPPNHKGTTILAQTSVDSRVLKVKSPPPPSEARAIAKEIERCYTEDKPTTVAVKIGAKHFSLPADAIVDVWMPAADAAAAFAAAQ